MEPELEIELVGEPTTPVSTSDETAVDITNPQYVNLPRSVVEERAHKANLGLGSSSPGLDQLREAIGRGDEEYARNTSAAELTIKERDNRQVWLLQMAQAQPAGSPVSQDDADLIAGLRIEPVVDPRTVWEESYSSYLTGRLITDQTDPDGAINGALAENPASTFANLDLARDLITKNERVNNRLAEMQARWKDMGFWDSAGTILETVVPGKSSINIEGKASISGILLPGNSLKEQVENLLAIPDPKAFAAKLDETVDRIADTNILDAMTFLQAVKQYSLNDQFISNVFGILDAADVTGLTAAVSKGLLKGGMKIAGKTVTKAEAESVKAVTDTLKATTGPQRPAEIAGKIGAVNESAALKILAKHEGENVADVPGRFEDRVRVLTDQMPTFSKPGNIFDGEANLGNAQATRIGTVLENNANKFIDTLSNTVTPTRLTPEALARAVQTAKEEIRREFQYINDSVLDVVRNPTDPLTNTDSVSVRLGKTSAETFGSSNEAQMYAKDMYQLPDKTYTIGQQGTSFYIDVKKPLRETDVNTQDLMVTTTNQTPVPNIATMFVQGLRTPAELFSGLQKANRDVALMGNTNISNFLTEVAKPIGALSKNERRNLTKVMEQNRDFIDPVTGTRGRYYETVQELEQGYMDTLNRFPSEKEVEAYYTAVQINEMDLMLRNFTAYRDLSRQGIEEFKVKIGYSGYSEYSAPKFLETPRFKGKEVDSIPWGNNDMLPVAIVDETGTGAKVVYRTSPQSDRDYINSLLKDHNYKIIQVARPQERVLKDGANIKEAIQYIVTKSHTKEPLDFQQVGRQAGFHVEYADPYYIKQPRVSVQQGGVRMYEGDATLWSIQTKAQGKKFEERVNALREAIRQGVEDLNPYISGKLPENEAWWRRQFAEDGFFQLDQPFRVVPRGGSVRDQDASIKALRDLSSGDNTLTGEMDRKFQGERSQQLLSPVEGTEENPAIRLRSAPMIDPLSTTSRGIGQATRSRYFGDMKISVADQFVTEFGDLLDATPQELAKYPMYYLHNPPWAKGVDAQRLAAAQAIQKTTLEFVGQQSPFGKQLQWVEGKLMDTVYNTMGGAKAEKLRTVQDFVNSRDPMSYFRAWAFRAKMGFFNVQQLFVQAQGLSHITAIAPQHALQSMAAYAFTRALSLNDSPEIVKGAAQKLGALGWKPAHFEESYALMKKTGWQNVGREATFIDDMSDPKLYEGSVGKWLDKSAIFFTETERMVRTTAWHTAYREWRTANPLATATNREIGQILSRADTMTLNMTNASKSSWERGILSIPAQFQSYGVRLFEQMWGGQLSVAEKARVLGMNSAMYGIPVGLSGVAAYPLYEDIKQYAMEKGYTVNDTFIELMLEGIPAMTATALGLGNYNFGQRYGPGGISLIKDMLNGDKTLAEAALGPSGSVYKDIFLNAIPAGAVAVVKALTGDEYAPEVQDLINAARTITTVNAADRIYMAATIQKYISRKGVVLSDTTTPDAIISAVTGMQPREFSDAMIMNQSIKDLEERKKEIRGKISQDLSNALREAVNGNTDTAESFMTRVRALVELGDFTPQEVTSMFQSTVGGKDKTLLDRVKRDWVMKAPASKRLDRLKQMETNQ